MPAKAPIYLKAGNQKKGKKFKLRDILSPDMISPPLGDCRHTSHIGKEGQQDVFGDVSFLQGNYELLPGNDGTSNDGDFEGCTEFTRTNSTCRSMFSETPFPALKNAISLPTIGSSQALSLPLLSQATFHSKHDTFPGSKAPRLSCDPVVDEKLKNNAVLFDNGTRCSDKSSLKSNGDTSSGTIDRVSNSSSLSEQYDWQQGELLENGPIASEQCRKNGSKPEESIPDLSCSLLSMQLDLGPSLLEEVLSVMDRHKF
ncbi:cdc42 effector protein 3-like [Ambystoma mexicanum]|uniref:cdc42 effector protein 3-like n=1 Tax=Ambystoma mexicanum TaxID=8296 RepID=UPI0037E89B19